jgi:hypothetical protein
MKFNKFDPQPSTLITEVKDLIDEVNDLKLFREFVLQDPSTTEKFEQYKTYRILKDQ